VVHARRYFTKQNNAFQHSWQCSYLWMHPPPSGQLPLQAVEHLLQQRATHPSIQAVVMLDAVPYKPEVQQLVKACDEMCFLKSQVGCIVKLKWMLTAAWKRMFYTRDI